jgi:RNA polymerase sigma-70 factor (ECF subfamily)
VVRGSRTKKGRAVSSEDAKLAEWTRNGDAAAYERLVRLHGAVAFRTAYVITSGAAEAEDAAQEAFVKTYRALNRFRSGAPLRPWLFSIIANDARNHRKAAGRRSSLALRAAAQGPEGTSPSPDAAVVAAERRAELLLAVEGLGPRSLHRPGPEKVGAELSFKQESEELRWDRDPGAETEGVPTVAAS